MVFQGKAGVISTTVPQGWCSFWNVSRPPFSSYHCRSIEGRSRGRHSGIG